MARRSICKRRYKAYKLQGGDYVVPERTLRHCKVNKKPRRFEEPVNISVPSDEVSHEDVLMEDVQMEDVHLEDVDTYNDSDFVADETASVLNDFEKELLYPGSQITRKESTILIYSYVQRFKQSNASLKFLLKILNLHLPKGASVPRSKYLLEKELEPDFTGVKKRTYCPACEESVSNEQLECPNCNSAINPKKQIALGMYYLQFDVRQSLRELLEIDEIGEKLLNAFERRNEPRNDYTDIMDGECYKQLPLGPVDFTCCINTDGVSTFGSSNAGLWPLYLSINELPYIDRRKHTTLVAMWTGIGKPKFSVFLTDFVNQCNDISLNGIKWTHRGQEITSKVFFTCICADSAARCNLQGVKQYTGFNSCNWCLIKGETCFLETGGHKTVFPASSGEHELRTAETFKGHLLQLEEIQGIARNEDVCGINGFSPLVELQQFDVVNGFSIDYMHTGLLGVLRTFTHMFVDSKNSKYTWYVGTEKQGQVISKLQHCKVPYEVSRSTRDLNDIAYWKAHEWKTWLLVCLPILKGLLPVENLMHLSKLVFGLSLLLTDSVSEQAITTAEKKLKEFTVEAEQLYGKQVCTFNLHLLNHFGNCVRSWGPLWCYSLFQFEHANGQLTRMINGTSQVAMQIARKLCIQQAIRSTSARYMIHPEAAEVHKELSDHVTVYKNSYKCDNKVTFVGPRKKYTLNDIESKMMTSQKISAANIDTIWSYKHFFIGRRKFCTTRGDSKKYCNSIAVINGKFHMVSKALLILYKTGQSLPVVFSNELLVDTISSLKDAKLVFKVNSKSDKISISECKHIYNIKCITIFDENYQITHLCKILNSTELE
jgi:hypothetical protein